MPGYDPQQSYRDAVENNLRRNDYIAQRMQNGGSPGGGGFSCLGAVLVLAVLLFAIGLLTHGVLFVTHWAEHLLRFL